MRRQLVADLDLQKAIALVGVQEIEQRGRWLEISRCRLRGARPAYGGGGFESTSWTKGSAQAGVGERPVVCGVTRPGTSIVRSPGASEIDAKALPSSYNTDPIRQALQGAGRGKHRAGRRVPTPLCRVVGAVVPARPFSTMLSSTEKSVAPWM